MFRALLVLVTAALVLLATGIPQDFPSHLLDPTHSNGALVSSGGTTATTTGTGVIQRPVVRALSMPSELVLSEPGTVRVQAEAPAAPGDRVLLRTAGTYGLGYNRVSQSVLDADLRATLAVPGRRYLGSYNYWVTIPATATYQEGQSATFPIEIVTAPPPASPTCGDATPQKADGSDWQCTFDDEFDGDSLDRRYWVPQVTSSSGFTTGTRSTYACGADTPDTIDVSKGYLELSLVELPAKQACGKNKASKYAFGQVMHFQTFSQTYGKYEIRAKIPDLDVAGSQQSFWLWPKKNTYGPWPASGEIDFAEMYSSQPGLDRPYLHYLPGATTAGTNQNITHANCQINRGEFNTYGVVWKPRQITVLLNGEVCFTDDYSSATAAFNGATAPFDKPFYLSLNQAMGTTGNEYDTDLVPDRVTTQVDYVRIWK